MLESCLWPALVCALLNPSLFGKEKPKRKQKEGGKRGQMQMSSGFFLRRRGVVRGSPLPLSSCFSPARCPSAAALRWTAAPSTSAIWRSRQPHQLVTPTTSSVRPHFLGAAGTLIHTRRHPHYASGQPEQQQVPPPPWRAFTLLPLRVKHCFHRRRRKGRILCGATCTCWHKRPSSLTTKLGKCWVCTMCRAQVRKLLNLGAVVVGDGGWW
jgi:hypothetical protein